MNSEIFCGLYEHQTSIRMCLHDKCIERSRFICKLCNTTKLHSHNQANNDHIIDYEQIVKIQESLKEQSYWYHFHSYKIKQIQNVLEECKYQIQKLEAQLQKYAKYYDRYFENLFAVQYYFSQQIDQENNQIAKMINEIKNFDQDKFLKSFHKISNNIMQKTNESTYYMLDLSVNDDQDKMLKLVNHKLKEIDYSYISQDGKYLDYGSQNLLTYDIIEQVNESILLNYNDMISFQISQAQNQFYIGDTEGRLRVYDKNRRKGVQFHMQKQEIVDIKVISKNLVILKYDGLPDDYQQVQVVNLKLNKIIYIFKIPNIIQQIIYSDVDNFLIIVQPSCVDVITLDSKLKRKEKIQQDDIRTVYYNQNCQQLIILDYDWHLTFYDLKLGQFENSHMSNQLNQYKNKIINFTFNENFQLLIILTYEGLIIQNIQGQIIKTLNCNYSQKGIYNTIFS